MSWLSYLLVFKTKNSLKRPKTPLGEILADSHHKSPVNLKAVTEGDLIDKMVSDVESVKGNKPRRNTMRALILTGYKKVGDEVSVDQVVNESNHWSEIEYNLRKNFVIYRRN